MSSTVTILLTPAPGAGAQLHGGSIPPHSRAAALALLINIAKAQGFEAFTDSTLEQGAVKLVWKSASAGKARSEVFNGALEKLEPTSSSSSRLRLRVASNAGPNTFDRTLVTVRNGPQAFTFAMDDLKQGPLFLPHASAPVLPEGDGRDYAVVAAALKAAGDKSLYDRVAETPEQTWGAAWEGMPPKKSHIYLPLELDSGRQRFQLNADDSVRFRSDDQYLQRRPGNETPRLVIEPTPSPLPRQPRQ